MAKIVCPNCNQSYEVDDNVLGEKVECAVCNTKFTACETKSDEAVTVLTPPTPVEPTTRTRLDRKLIALFSVCGAVIVVLLIAIIVLLVQRDTGGSMAYSSKPVGSLPPGTPSELLLKYAEMGETPYVAEVLKQNPSFEVDRPRADGNKTALYLACEKGYEDIVKLLLKRKADAAICDSETDKKYSPLTIAASNGHLAVVQALLKSGINIEARDEENRTALYAAAANGKLDVVKYLCESKAQVNTNGRNNFTPLIAAAFDGDSEVVNVLLKYGADLEKAIKNNQGVFTAVYAASIDNHPGVVEILCKAGADVNVYGYDGWTPLTVAIERGFSDVVDALLKYGKGIDLEMKEQNTRAKTAPLNRAVFNNKPEIAELLCKAGADTNQFIGSYTYLNWAVDEGYIEIVKILLKYGADPYQKDNSISGKNAFETARKNNRQDIVDLLRNPPRLEQHDTSKTSSSSNLKSIHEYVMESINTVQNGNYSGEAGSDLFISRLQTTKSKLQQRMVSQNAPDDYRNAVLDLLSTQINSLSSLRTITQSSSYRNVSSEKRQELALKYVKENLEAYKNLNVVLRKYGLKEIDDASGKF